MPGIKYRAVHTRSKWRKVNTHKSLESALDGVNGARGLFCRKVRIDYKVHGDPLYVFAWEDGALDGWAVRNVTGQLDKRSVPVHVLEKLDRSSGDSVSNLNELFR